MEKYEHAQVLASVQAKEDNLTNVLENVMEKVKMSWRRQVSKSEFFLISSTIQRCTSSNRARGTTLFSMDSHLRRERLQNKKSNMLQKIV